MAWNSTFTRFKSTGLARVDCGQAQKMQTGDQPIVLADVFDGDLEIGQCVGMFVVPAGYRVLGGHLSVSGSATAVTLNPIFGVGDHYACGRFVVMNAQFGSGTSIVGAPYGVCGTFMKVGRIGDGCGLWYRYTCDTMIQISNLYGAASSNQGGWPWGSGPSSDVSNVGVSKWTGGRLYLQMEITPSA